MRRTRTKNTAVAFGCNKMSAGCMRSLKNLYTSFTLFTFTSSENRELCVSQTSFVILGFHIFFSSHNFILASSLTFSLRSLKWRFFFTQPYNWIRFRKSLEDMICFLGYYENNVSESYTIIQPSIYNSEGMAFPSYS